MHLCGGLESFVPMYFVFHMICATAILSWRECVLHASLAVLLMVVLANLEYYGFLPHRHLLAVEPSTPLYRNGDYLACMILILGSVLFLALYLANYLSAKVRRGQATLRAKAVELYAFYNTSKMIASTIEIDKIYDKVMQRFSRAYNTRAYSLMLSDKETGELAVVASSGLTDEAARTRLGRGKGVPGEVLASSTMRSRQTRSPSPPSAHFYSGGHLSAEPYVSLPLIVRGEGMGVLNVHKQEGERFGEMEIQLLATIAGNLALALSNTKMYQKIERLAITDGLTGLFNHRHFHIQLEMEMARSTRYGKKLSLVLFDIDHFKRFNDTYGHLAGDRILRDMGSIIGRISRQYDVAARYGGEEFALILPETDLDGGAQIAERIRAEVEMHELRDQESGQVYRVTISAGVACLQEREQKTKEDLIQEADSMLYSAKRQGRNRVTAQG